MRTEEEVFQQLITFAENNDKVRAVLLNGSRVNPNLTNDIFSDYDVIFAVTDPKFFLENQNWMKSFGEILIMQQNDISDEFDEAFIFLMLFTDGVRIDLSFRNVASIHHYLDDSLTKKLLDKDQLIGELEPPSERSYYTKKPTKQEFDKTVNEFFWIATNVAKGIWRDELPYVKFMYDVIMRDALTKLLKWYIGMHKDWTINTGKAGRWFKKYLSTELWDSYKRTNPGADYQEIWNAIFEASQLVRKVGKEIAEQLGYEYPTKDDEQVIEYLKKVQNLAKDAKDF